MPDLDLRELFTDAVEVGHFTDLTFTGATLLTGKDAETHAGGVLLGSWLLAVRNGDEEFGPVLMFRVTTSRTAPSDLVTDLDYDRDLGDLGTPYRVYETKLMGVFGADEDRVVFASQADAVGSPDEYTVHVPSALTVAAIASYSRDSDPTHMPVGVVRFSSARLAAAKAGRDSAPVHLNVNDFVGRRSAIFGITRSGKSSVIKTLATAVVKQAAVLNQPIGQIIFDPQGEYAEFNQQDGTALRLVGDQDSVRIYRAVIDAANPDPKERSLLLDFYDPSLLDVVWDIVSDAIAKIASAEVRAFASVDLTEPDLRTRTTDWEAWSRGRLAFYALLHKCGFPGGFPKGGDPLWFVMSEDASGAYIQEQSFAHNKHLVPVQNQSNPLYWGAENPEQCAAIMDWFLSKIDAMNRETSIPPTPEGARRIKRLRDILGDGVGSWDDMGAEFWQVGRVARTAKTDILAALRPLVGVHESGGRVDVAEAIWEDMVSGRLVIVDLSIGSDAVVKMMARRIVERLLAEENALFRAGKPPVPVQIIAEEAHNLFERGQMAAGDPWVRIAKEGAKYRIGLMYATQEVTSIDQRILANTHNWVIAHLNSDVEVDELSQYSGFADFATSIREADEVGYVRLKTLSSPFVVPAQFSKFDHHAINDARVAQGLEPLETDAVDDHPHAVVVPATVAHLTRPQPRPAPDQTYTPPPAAQQAQAPAQPVQPVQPVPAAQHYGVIPAQAPSRPAPAPATPHPVSHYAPQPVQQAPQQPQQAAPQTAPQPVRPTTPPRQAAAAGEPVAPQATPNTAPDTAVPPVPQVPRQVGHVGDIATTWPPNWGGTPQPASA